MHGGDIYSSKIKHDFSVNINPFGFFAHLTALPAFAPLSAFTALTAFSAFFSGIFSALKTYPEIKSDSLRKFLGKKYSVNPANIVVGNGASEIIFAAVKAVNPQKALVISPCFSGYLHALSSLGEKGADTIFFPLEESEDFALTEAKIDRLSALIAEGKPDMLFLCNPNNPNGRVCQKDAVVRLVKFCSNTGTIVLLDECFMELSGKPDCTLTDAAEKFPNLILVNAFTKTYAVPGLRLGYCFCGSQEIAEEMWRQLPEWNVSSVAQKIGIRLLEKNGSIARHAEKISFQRNYLAQKLTALGLKVYSSDANFLLFRSDFKINLKEKLLEKQILVRDCSDYQNLGEGFYRVAVKTRRENRILVEALEKILEKK
ncbi:MAG: aminotransferase class I/II-fold pyridoxal phosphate-dependent enzyme [Treponemataceae bacterium]|nr:aminotransferase class I/II-fold pyridoxal phosphate-dependent enzyme [Treponemataceae bacterium]